MKAISITMFTLWVFEGLGFCHGTEVLEKGFLGEKAYLKVMPIVKSAAIDNGRVILPFSITNNYSQDVIIMLPWNRINGLVVLDKFGDKEGIETYANGSTLMSGPIPATVTLGPGETGTFDSIASIDSLSVVAHDGREIFGEVTGRLARTKQAFLSYSNAFQVPADVVKQPWVDLGEQNYFSVSADISDGFIFGGSVLGRIRYKDADYSKRVNEVWGEYFCFPVKIANAGQKPYIAASDDVRFYIARPNSRRVPPSPRDSFKADSFLKPGETTYSSGRCYLWISTLEAQGYKKGDKIVAAVGGRVPGTNEIFESYSPPFELPSLPAGHSPKAQTDFDDILKKAAKAPN